MAGYFLLWKRGWWFALLQLCSNLAFGLLALPLALVFHDSQEAYWLSTLALWLLIGAPLSGWLFEHFAAGSPRLISRGASRDIENDPPGSNAT
jgi:hypothetical protein